MQPVPFEKIKLDAELIEAFSIAYLHRGFDEAKPVPQFHRDAWDLYCSDEVQAGCVAPRGHAKSTSLTHVFVLANCLFRVENYVILISTNEELAIEHLGDITRELVENEELINDFEIKGFVTNSKTEIIVEFIDGHQFRILARGSGQKMRGRKWRGSRPGLIVCDDLEDDEQVESKERRNKFGKWFFRAVKPTLRKGGRLRIHGTILHEDSLLMRLYRAPDWHVLFYKAHKSFDDFSEILWPEQHSEESLRAIRQAYIGQFDAAGYSQEYLNDPFDNSEAYFEREGFVPMGEDDFEKNMFRYVGVDFAISTKDKANRTSMTVGGVCSDNILYILDQHVGRWNTLEIIDLMFELEDMHQPIAWFVEDGVIWKAISPMMEVEMQKRNLFLNIIPIPAIKDKGTNGRSLQKRMKAKAVRFNTTADWYPAYEDELRRFTGVAQARLDDQVDSSTLLSRGLEQMPLLDDDAFEGEEEAEMRRQDPATQRGRDTITGY